MLSRKGTAGLFLLMRVDAPRSRSPLLDRAALRWHSCCRWRRVRAARASGLTAAGTLQSPEQFIGFKVGADNKLVRWDKIVEYMKLAAADSDRVRLPRARARPAAAIRSSRSKSASPDTLQEPRPVQAARAPTVLPGRSAERARARRDLPAGQGRRARHLQRSRHRDRRHADGARAGPPARDRRLAGGEEDPRQRDLPPGAER